MLHMIDLMKTLRRWQEHKRAAEGASQMVVVARTPDNGAASKSRYPKFGV